MLKPCTIVAAALAFASPALAQTEIQWWRAQTGGNAEVINGLSNEFNASQKDYKVVPTYKGNYPDTLNAGIAAFRAGGAPHILQVFEVGTATMMSAKGAVKPVYELMKDANEPFDRQGRNAVLPVQFLIDGDVGEPGCVEEGEHRRDPEDLAGGFRRGEEVE